MLISTDNNVVKFAFNKITNSYSAFPVNTDYIGREWIRKIIVKYNNNYGKFYDKIAIELKNILVNHDAVVGLSFSKLSSKYYGKPNFCFMVINYALEGEELILTDSIFSLTSRKLTLHVESKFGRIIFTKHAFKRFHERHNNINIQNDRLKFFHEIKNLFVITYYQFKNKPRGHKFKIPLLNGHFRCEIHENNIYIKTFVDTKVNFNEDFDKNRYFETLNYTIDLLKVFKNLDDDNDEIKNFYFQKSKLDYSEIYINSRKLNN